MSEHQPHSPETQPAPSRVKRAAAKLGRLLRGAGQPIQAPAPQVQEQIDQADQRGGAAQQAEREAQQEKVVDRERILAAQAYVEATAPKWVLEPAPVPVEEPADQAELLANFDSMVRAEPEGERIARLFQGNLESMAQKAESDDIGASKLHLKAGFPLGDTSRMSREEYRQHMRDGSSDEEYTNDPNQPNMMLSALLISTGAVTLRDDIADGNTGGDRVYKGMLKGKPVYIAEKIRPREQQNPDGTTQTEYVRTAWAETEQTAHHSLNALSDNDQAVLSSLGVEQPILGSAQDNIDNRMNRPRMAETINLYAATSVPGGPAAV
jgi:hypothetical protein